MTKISKPSRNFFKLLFVLSGLLGACAKPGSLQNSTSRGLVSKDMAGVIGGEPVKDSEEYSNKVLYLATGVKMVADARAGTKVSWNGHCTASAISTRVILTAAHCVEGQKLEQLSVVLTKNPALTALNPGDWYSVKAVKVHEAYIGQKNGFLNDLALILLTREIPDSRVLRMAEADLVELPMDFMAVGYGKTTASADPNEKGKNSSMMNSVMKIVEDFDVSQKTFSINQNDHKGFCSGDSGGPGLVYDPESHEYLILGVVSNVSLMDADRARLDPTKKYSLCIGQGNYVNITHPELRQWIEESFMTLTAGL